MKKRSENPAQWMRRVFPDDRARDSADLAIDALDVAESMSTYLDAWVKAYLDAGGQSLMGGDSK